MTTALLEQVILIVHLLLALAIIGLIMLQQGKGAEMGASFGAGASQTLFGSSGGGNVLTRATAWLVALFFASSFGLAVLAKQKTSVDSSDLGIPVPAVEQRAVDEIPSADSAVPTMDASFGDELPRAPADAGGEATSGGDEMPSLDTGPEG